MQFSLIDSSNKFDLVSMNEKTTDGDKKILKIWITAATCWICTGNSLPVLQKHFYKVFFVPSLVIIAILKTEKTTNKSMNETT